jgi:hypothetical protein
VYSVKRTFIALVGAGAAAPPLAKPKNEPRRMVDATIVLR